CECERSSEISLPQLLHFMNSREMLLKIGGKDAFEETAQNAGKKEKPVKEAVAAGNKVKITPGERVNRLLADKRPHSEKIRELFLIALSREIRPEELRLLLSHIELQGANVRFAYEDIV